MKSLHSKVALLLSIACFWLTSNIGAKPIITDTAKKVLPIDTMFGGHMAAVISWPEPDKSIAINIRDKGVSPENTGKQNSDAIDVFINSFPEGSTPSVYIPAGDYHFARTIKLYRRPFRIFGDNGTIWGNSTKLYFAPGQIGILVQRGGVSIQETIIERLCIIMNNSIKGQFDGIGIQSRCKIRDVTVKGSPWNGFGIWANTEEGNDASATIFLSCHSLENDYDGFFAGRVDANAISFINCDARDNGRYGFNDDSFLGNYFFGCMAHNNKSGHYYVRDKGNARSSFIACYAESDGPPNDFSPLTTVVGGFLANGYNKHDGKGVIKQ
jgi:hypothetical protein